MSLNYPRQYLKLFFIKFSNVIDYREAVLVCVTMHYSSNIKMYYNRVLLNLGPVFTRFKT